MIDAKELLRRADTETLSKEELTAVAAELRNLGDDADPYTLIHILGKARATEHEDLVRSFLESPQDPMLARISLHVLCQLWGLTDRYLSDVHRFARHVVWDTENDVRIVAISSLGEYLREKGDTKALTQLLHVFDDESEPRSVRDAAYFAVARAMGIEWDEMPSAAKHVDLEAAARSDVIRAARRRVHAR